LLSRTRAAADFSKKKMEKKEKNFKIENKKKKRREEWRLFTKRNEK
jgi:hypothetical protein